MDLSSLFSHLLGRPFIRAVVAPAPRRTEVLPPRAGRPAAAAGRQGAAAEDAHGLGPTGALRDARWTNLQLLEVVCYKNFHTDTHWTHTHTCSETSYRIVDVECIGRAKNTSVKPNRRHEKKI